MTIVVPSVDGFVGNIAYFYQVADNERSYLIAKVANVDVTTNGGNRDGRIADGTISAVDHRLRNGYGDYPSIFNSKIDHFNMISADTHSLIYSGRISQMQSYDNGIPFFDDPDSFNGKFIDGFLGTRSNVDAQNKSVIIEIQFVTDKNASEQINKNMLVSYRKMVENSTDDDI